MNRFIFLNFSILLSLFLQLQMAQAATAAKTKAAKAVRDRSTVYLQYKTNYGPLTQKSLVIERQRILVSSRPIDSSRWPLVMPAIKAIAATKNTVAKACDAGYYQLNVTARTGAERKESGCINTKRFSELLDYFSLLQMHAQMD